MMILRPLLILMLITLSLGCNRVWALDDEFYYSIGGGAPIRNATTNRNAITLNAGTSWNSDLICGNFDIGATITSQLNGALNNLWNNIVARLTGMIASWATLALQRLDPVLYDQLQNGVLQATETYNLADLDCRKIVGDLMKSSENEGWDRQAEAEYWKTDSNSGSAEIVDTQDQAELTAGNDGVTWIDGVKAGGLNQPSIKVNKETSIAGYNLLLRRNVTNTAPVSTTACAGAALCQSWASPTQAANWLTDVIGDKEIQTCVGCNKMKAVAGHGLSQKIEIEKNQIEADLLDLVNGVTRPDPPTLALVKGGTGITVTRQLIEAIRDEDNPHALVSHLSGELALSRVMEDALMARRMLLAGMKEPNVANNKDALESLQLAIDELNQEIENTVFELDVRARVTSNTAVKLLQRARMRKVMPVVEQPVKQTIQDGATP